MHDTHNPEAKIGQTHNRNPWKSKPQIGQLAQCAGDLASSKLLACYKFDGIAAWGLTFESYLNPLFRLQKRVLRCIKFEAFTAPSAPIFQTLKILKLEDTLHLNILTFVYKAINRLSPSCFRNYFQPNSTIHKIGTRQATRGDLFKSLKNTTLYGLQTIQYFGSKLWNTLPLFIRAASSVAVFRSKLKPHFLDSFWKFTSWTHPCFSIEILSKLLLFFRSLQITWQTFLFWF